MGSQVSTTKTQEENIQEMYELHNKFRAAHGVPSLQLDPQLNIHAQEWAEKLESWGKLESSANIIGENCFLSSTHHLIAAHAVNVWYSERFDFDWDGDYENQKGAEHFTQIVWKDTRKMGGGYKSGSHGTYIVAVYVPPGNIPGHFRANVVPVLPTKTPTKKQLSVPFGAGKFKNINKKIMNVKNAVGSKSTANIASSQTPTTTSKKAPQASAEAIISKKKTQPNVIPRASTNTLTNRNMVVVKRNQGSTASSNTNNNNANTKGAPARSKAAALKGGDASSKQK